MLALEYQQVADRFVQFSNSAQRFLHIQNEADYLVTLDLIESLMDCVADETSDPLNQLIELLANAVEEYELKQESFSDFHQQAECLKDDVSVLRLLMDHYCLSAADLKEEIGSMSLVSMILSGQCSLTKEHIANLTQRFNISPALFFTEGYIQEKAALEVSEKR